MIMIVAIMAVVMMMLMTNPFDDVVHVVGSHAFQRNDRVQHGGISVPGSLANENKTKRTGAWLK